MDEFQLVKIGLIYSSEFSSLIEVFCFRSEAKIVVVGSGADELFGGYMRHRTTYLRKGRNAVVEELRKELKRIGERNLGRDDRVVSSLGKDLRFVLCIYCSVFVSMLYCY